MKQSPRQKHTTGNKGISVINVSIIAFVIILVIGIGVLAANTNNNTPPKAKLTATAAVSGRLSRTTLQASQTWQPNYNNLTEAMNALHLPGLSDTVFHQHVHLDIYIYGKHIVIPSQIGISGSVASPLHTHDTSGVVHIESDDTNFKPLLGYFFDMWGVSLSRTSLGGYTNNANNTLQLFVNGKAYTGDPMQLPLNSHDEIVLAYGSASQLPSPLPASFKFQAGE